MASASPSLQAKNGVRGLFLTLALGATAASANQHPLLAQDSPWPACHGNAFASDSTDWPGPAGAVSSGSGLTAQLVTHPALASRSSSYLPVSLVFGGALADGGQAVWGTSVSAVMLLQVVNSSGSSGSKLQLADTFYTGSIDLSCVPCPGVKSLFFAAFAKLLQPSPFA